jgi:ketosteroid isomerase-like protein
MGFGSTVFLRGEAVLIGLLLAVGLQVRSQDAFDVQSELRGLYDEIAQATLQFTSEADVDEFHSVLYTPDWSVVDSKGQRHAWPELRQRAIAALKEPMADSINPILQKVTLEADGATALVMVETVRTIVDTAGRYGRPGLMHTITEDAVFRDRWVMIAGSWKLKAREEIGQPKTWVDRPVPDTH